jgi:hypothetical protein
MKAIDRKAYGRYNGVRGAKRKAPWKLALSLLLIAALIIPQAVLAADAAEPQAAAGQSVLVTDGGVAADIDDADNDGGVAPDGNTDNNPGITIDSALTAGEDSLEDSGGGGRR